MRPNPQETTELVTFTEETLNGKLHFLCSADYISFRNTVLLLILYFTVFLILNLNSHKRTKNSIVLSIFVFIINMRLRAWFYRILLLLSGDVQLNPGLKRNSGNKFSICHWNLNSIYMLTSVPKYFS